MSILNTAWSSLTDLGLAPGASLDRLRIETDLEAALDGAEFVQESAPERLEIKQALYARMGEFLPPSVVIGSSTSGLTMTEIQATCPTPERTVIGHPVQPAISFASGRDCWRPPHRAGSGRMGGLVLRRQRARRP